MHIGNNEIRIVDGKNEEVMKVNETPQYCVFLNDFLDMNKI